MEEEKKQKLKELIEELESYKGRHTELITIYASAGSSLSQLASQVIAEQSTAQNIKSKTTRTNVIDALERIIRHLKLYKELPKNGLAIFCGNISKKEGESDIRLWVIEPPQPLKTKLYRCDQVFVLDPLKEMLEAKDVYGLIVLDRREATIGLLEGKSIIKLKHLTSGVPGKFKTGGSSAARFDRLTEEMAKEFYRRISEHVKELFFERPRLKGLLLGGPGPTKEEWLKEGDLVSDLKRKIIAIKDVSYTNEQGLEELVHASQDVLQQEEIMKEKQLLNKFFSMLSKNKMYAAYGLEHVKKALEVGAVEILILSTNTDKKLQQELKEKASLTGAKVELVSEETQEGIQFKNLGGIGAILRFAVEKPK
ncbi:MAG: peptide chain release factor aRF-1 [Candidatus Pacearchaeota archaeon]|nr:peptide chain release factor aRF-1 [Candidatus Pacearchaeota archaeon]